MKGFTYSINWGDSHIDSRDITERYEELQTELDDLESDLDESAKALESWKADNEFELNALKDIVEQGESSSDWSYGETLIHDSAFDDYAEELAKDCCDVPVDQWNHWPFNCIDWSLASGQLKYDYTEITHGSESYWIRS